MDDASRLCALAIAVVIVATVFLVLNLLILLSMCHRNILHLDLSR